MKSFDQVSAAVKIEIGRSIKKHGMFASPRAGHSILEEEYDEFWDAIKADNIPHAVEEATQLAAMAIKFIQTYG